MCDFKTQEVVEMSKIFHVKLLTEKILEFLNAIKVITSYDHIIHTYNKALTEAQVCYAHVAEEERNKQNQRSEGGDNLEVT